MRDQTLTIGLAPTEETCAQVGQPGYDAQSRLECRVFRRMLERLFPVAVEVPARFIVKSFPHDFGTYREVCVRYDDADARAVEHAYRVEANTPPCWDPIAAYERLWLERKETLHGAVRRGEMRPDDIPEIYRTRNLPAMPADRCLSELLAAFPL